ncbi:hypothetical protein VFPPC_15096 [Pochonia chlamydosporia 170]|uniref:Secreted protein n=1 Tax=Pochonia chlamydosporia 170 TaxID=1380566 RepID=A0A179G469_METCM|nr:hypothetical protein VFPPC_15096 [Pochonia chlamydosporia 170]OAQ72278.1 hypothetical protein VFPPC_15096 [Pochonia chlamydosporia 170]
MKHHFFLTVLHWAECASSLLASSSSIDPLCSRLRREQNGLSLRSIKHGRQNRLLGLSCPSLVP